jgi:KTSC domain
MNRAPVSSSNVSSIGWEPLQDGAHEGTLEVAFKSGHVYQYENVPESVYQALMGASSIGGYLRQAVIGVYEASRIG